MEASSATACIDSACGNSPAPLSSGIDEFDLDSPSPPRAHRHNALNQKQQLQREENPHSLCTVSPTASLLYQSQQVCFW
jgi:hypothetical protein